MRAIILEKTGGVENLIYTEIDKPEVKANEVLIEVDTICINPVDCKVRSNETLLDNICGKERPAILGWDISGKIVEAGIDVYKFLIGHRVFGMVNFVGAGNAYAEYVIASQDHLARIPHHISFEKAAATNLAALTAYQVLRDKIKPNDRVLIHAGSGGVGHYAIQIAKSMGAHVITTCSGKNKDFVMSLKADEHIDYTEKKFQDELSDLDFVFDMFNGDILLNSIKIVKKGGHVVSIPSPDFSEEIQALAKERGVNLSFHMVQSNGEDMHAVRKMLDDLVIKPHISKVFDFEEMAEAHSYVESGRTVGKVIVKLKDPVVEKDYSKI